MPRATSTPATRLATRIGFFVAGFMMAVWAPLVPYAKEFTGSDDRQLGQLLLCLGIGSLIAMPITGVVSSRTGAKPMILAGAFGISIALPLLMLAHDPLVLGAGLLLVGASLGTLDVSINVHAVEVEKGHAGTLMSGFHGMFSVGGLFGAAFTSFLLTQGFSPFLAAATAAVIAICLIIFAMPKFLSVEGGEAPAFVLPKGIVLLFALLAAIAFMAEGALLDWGALLLLDQNMIVPAQGGYGYMAFSVTMSIGRFTGDRIISALGSFMVLLIGGILAVLGFALLLMTDSLTIAMFGFALIGLGAANIVPVIFSAAGHQTIMPGGMAIAAVTTVGYAGILLGPAAIGYVAEAYSLPTAFWLVAALMAVIPLTAHITTRKSA